MEKKTELTSRQIQASEMKMRIYKNTIALYQKIPYNEVTIADICRASGISVGNFYHYYKNKEDILNQGYVNLSQRLDTALAQSALPPMEKLYAALAVYLRSIEECGYLYASIFLQFELGNRIPYRNNQIRSTFILISETLSQMVANSDLICDNIDELFIDIYRILKGTTFDWVIRCGQFSLHDEFFRLLDQLFLPYRPNSR